MIASVVVQEAKALAPGRGLLGLYIAPSWCWSVARAAPRLDSVSCPGECGMLNLVQRSDIDEESESHSRSDSGVQLQLFDHQDLTDA